MTTQAQIAERYQQAGADGRFNARVMWLHRGTGWYAQCRAHEGAEWQLVRDAKGNPIKCDNYSLAVSVGRMRAQRLQPGFVRRDP